MVQPVELVDQGLLDPLGRLDPRVVCHMAQMVLLLTTGDIKPTQKDLIHFWAMMLKLLDLRN